MKEGRSKILLAIFVFLVLANLYLWDIVRTNPQASYVMWLMGLLAGSFIIFGGVYLLFSKPGDEQSDQSKATELISLAAHQLRGPLATSRWHYEMLLSGDLGRLPKDAKETVTDLYALNNHAIALVNDLLNVSRLEQGALFSQPEPIDVCRLVKEIVDAYRPMASHKGIKIQSSCPKMASLKVDPILLRQVVTNVVDNAVKYSHDKSMVQVRVTRGEKLLIQITDQGIGIPVDEHRHIFQKFFRASNATSFAEEGTGLGMYTAKMMMNLIHGTISFKSSETDGTVFTITIPVS